MNKAFEKILERLEEYKYKHRGSEGHYITITNDLKEIVKEVEEEYNGGWIPCSERLPEDDVEVLVWFEYYRYGRYNRLFQTMGISYVYNGEWSGFVNGSSGWRDLRIIAWQPQPGPYKECE